MTSPLRLVIFDVDGTLVDSQVSIVAAMTAAFDGMGLPVPARSDVLSIVGLSLDEGMAALAGEHPKPVRDQLVTGYKAAFQANRHQLGAGSAPLYPGTLETLNQLHAIPDVLLGIATGKSRRGLDALLDAHGLSHMFVTQQVADHHPSKPHPSMVLTAMAETGVEPRDTVLIGDTRFDMDMAQAAGVTPIGVDWGYHPADTLHNAHRILSDFAELHLVLEDIWGRLT